MIPLDEVIHFDLTTRGASGVVDADSAPTFAVFEEDTDTAILSAQTMTKRTGLTGNYRGAITCSTANGFEVGKFYNVIATGTVAGTTDKTVAITFRVCAAETVVGVPEVDVTHLAGDAQSATDLKDFADAGYDPATNKVQGVVLVDTTTTNTDMRGTDNAALAAVWTGTLATNLGTTNTTVATNLNATVGSRSSHSAADVWAAGTRTLTAFGFTVTTNDAASIAAILADTNELQTDWADAGRLDLILDARSSQTSVTNIQTTLGTTINGSVSLDIADVKADTVSLLSRIPSAIFTGMTRMIFSLGAIAGKAADATRLAEINATPAGATYNNATDSLESQQEAALTAPQVNAEVFDVLNVDTFAEETGVPAATSSLRKKIGWMFMWFRNRVTQTGTTSTLFADDGTTPVATHSVSDDATTFTSGEGA